jgi:hypothetical protein
MTVSRGFGAKPWGFGGYGAPFTPSTPAAFSSLSSSRSFDGIKGRYVANDEGGFEAMDDTAQCMVLTVGFATKTGPFITPRDLAQQEATIRAALAVSLTAGSTPRVRLIEVTAAQTGPTASAVTVRYFNNLTNTEQTVSPRA